MEGASGRLEKGSSAVVSRSSARQIATFVVAIALALIVAACTSGEDPDPPSVTTPVPPEATAPAATPTMAAPTATAIMAAPTATPTMAAPTATPTIAAPTATATTAVPTMIPVPARTPISIDELEITEDTTLRDVIGALSDDEVRCMQGMVGAEAFDVVLDVPLSALPQNVGRLPTECLSGENAIGLSVAFLSSEAGGLDAETRSCVKEAVAATPSVLGLGEQPDNPLEIIIGALTMQLCLSDEEAAVLALGGENELPQPSALRCLAEQLGGAEAMLTTLVDGQDDPNAVFEVMLAAFTCEQGPTAASSP